MNLTVDTIAGMVLVNLYLYSQALMAPLPFRVLIES